MVRPVKDQGILKVKDQEQQWEASQLCPEGEGDQQTPGSGKPPAPAPLPWPPGGPGTSRMVCFCRAHQLTFTHSQAP